MTNANVMPLLNYTVKSNGPLSAGMDGYWMNYNPNADDDKLERFIFDKRYVSIENVQMHRLCGENVLYCKFEVFNRDIKVADLWLPTVILGYRAELQVFLDRETSYLGIGLRNRESQEAIRSRICSFNGRDSIPLTELGTTVATRITFSIFNIMLQLKRTMHEYERHTGEAWNPSICSAYPLMPTYDNTWVPMSSLPPGLDKQNDRWIMQT